MFFMWRSIVLVLLTSALTLFLWPAQAQADGPWQAQVVDAETKQPLEGVVVLAVWTKYVWGPLDLGGAYYDYYDSEEVLTDKDGRFTISDHTMFSLNPFAFFKGPEFLLFKPGYGRAVWPEYKNAEQWSKEKREQLNSYAKLFALDGIVLEMPRLRSVEERKEYLGTLGGRHRTPREKRSLLEKAITEERRAVGYRD